VIIGKTIKQLLEERIRVVLPGFGNLEVKESGGNVSTPGKQIAPPGLSIKFDNSFSKDDGVLAGAFAEAGGVDEAEAEQQVLELVDAIRFALDKGEKYPLADAGTFSRDEEGRTLFRPDPSWVLEMDQYGLDSMDLLELDDLPDEKVEPSVGDPGMRDSEQVQTEEEKPEQEPVDLVVPEKEEKPAEKPKEKPAPKTSEKPKEKSVPKVTEKPAKKMPPKPHEPWKNEKTKKRSGLWRVIWIVTGILILALVVLMVVPAEKWEMTGKKDHPEQAVQEEQPAETYGIADQSEDIKPQAEETPDSEPEPEPIPVESNHFFIVAGSFSNLRNASELQDKLKEMGYPAEVMVTENRMYRVSVESFSSRREAEASLAGLKSDAGMESCWLLSNE